MKENVGTADRVVRSLVGPALLAIGYTRLGARDGRPAALALMVAGTLVIESAITSVCPLNAALGRDSRGSARCRRDGAPTPARSA